MSVVSIIIPTYNYAAYLPEAVDSALRQATPSLEVEVIVVDDGSTDNTPEILSGYGDRILMIRTENHGVVHARNTGLEHMSGDYWCSLDADNILLPSFAREMVTEMTRRPDLGFLYCDRIIFGDTKERTVAGREFDLNNYQLKNFIDINTVLFRRAATGTHRFDPAFTLGWDDYDYCMGLVEAGEECARLPRPLVRYRVHGQSISADFIKHARNRKIQKAFLLKHGPQYPPATLKAVKAEHANQEIVRILRQRLPERTFRDRVRDLTQFLRYRGPLDKLGGQVIYTFYPGKRT